MTTTNDRILFIIKHFCEGNKAEFARIMDEKPQTVNGWLRRENGMSVLNKILGRFPEINKSWLLTGEGNMLSDNIPVPKSKDVPEADADIYHQMMKAISELSAQVERMNDINERNSRTIERLTELLFEKEHRKSV